MSDKKQVNVKIIGRQTPHGGSQDTDDMTETVTVARGDYYEKSGIIHVIYEETFEGNDTAKNHLILDKNQIRLRKTGAVEVNMMFEEDLVHNTVYKTCAGSIPISISSGAMRTEFHDRGFDVNILYKLKFEDMDPVDNHLTMNITYITDED